MTRVLARSVLLVGVAACILVLAVAGCRLVPAGGTSPTAGAATQATTPATASPGGEVVMGRVPYCGCSDNDGTATVATAIKNAQLTVSLKDLISKNGWMYFTATFDPAVPRDEVAAAIVAGGGQVVTGLP